MPGKSYVPSSWEENNIFFVNNIIGTKNFWNYCKKKQQDIMASLYIYEKRKELVIK